MTTSKVVLSGTLQGNRKLEVLCVFVVACSVIVGTIGVVVWRHNRLPDYSDWCGPDKPQFSINIDGAVPSGDGYKTKGGLFFPDGTFWKADNSSIFGCPCSIKPCIRKCCPPNQGYKNGECTCQVQHFDDLIRKFFADFGMIDSITKPIALNTNKNNFLFIYSDTFPSGKVHRHPKKGTDYLMTDGRILTIENNTAHYLDQSQYCLETLFEDSLISITEGSDECEEEPYWFKYVKACCMLISMPFFLITFIVYAALPSLRNLHGKSLMCYLACLMISYIGVSINNLTHWDFVKQRVFCNVLAYLSQFAWLAAFFWLNVMCFDMWWVFSGYSHCHAKGVAARIAERKRFIIYSTYAWGGPLFISGITACMDLVPGIPIDYIKPRFGINKCWFYGEDEEILYFYLPVMVLLCVNLFMFGTTARRLRAFSGSSSVNREEALKEGLHAKRKRYKLYLKLLAAMGLNWIMEVSSFFYKDHQIWLVTVVINALQGLITFYLFVCKRHILDLLRERFCPEHEYSLSNGRDARMYQPSLQTEKTEETDSRKIP